LENLIYPLLIWEIVKLKLEGKKLTKDFILNYFINKYPFVKENFIKIKIEQISFSQKKKIVEILRKIK